MGKKWQKKVNDIEVRFNNSLGGITQLRLTTGAFYVGRRHYSTNVALTYETDSLL